MFGQNTITGVTMSHPSQLATFTPPPPIFAHSVAVQAVAASQAQSLTAHNNTGLLQPVTATAAGGSIFVGIQQQQQQPNTTQQQQQQQQQHLPPQSPTLSVSGNGSIIGVSVGGYNDMVSFYNNNNNNNKKIRMSILLFPLENVSIDSLRLKTMLFNNPFSIFVIPITLHRHRHRKGFQSFVDH